MRLVVILHDEICQHLGIKRTDNTKCWQEAEPLKPSDAAGLPSRGQGRAH